MRPQILLTGASGFIGRNILESPLARKYDFCAPTHRELDLADTQAVDNFFKTHTFDGVIHAAAKPGHRNAKNPTNIFQTNLQIFDNLACHADKLGTFILLNSGAVYNYQADNRLVREEQIGQHPGSDELSRYKYAQHQRLISWPKAVELNLFGVFGKYEDWQIRFISNAICKTLFNLPITLRQNRRFSYLYIDDLMPVLDYFLTHEAKHKSYNITPDTETELLQAAQVVREVSGAHVDICVGTPGYGLNYSGDNTRLKIEIPGLTFTPFETAVTHLVHYYQQIKNQINPALLQRDK